MYGYIFAFCLLLLEISDIYGKKYKNSDLEDGSGDRYKVRIDKKTRQFKTDDHILDENIYKENKCKGKYCEKIEEENDGDHKSIDKNREGRFLKYAKKNSENNDRVYKKQIRSRQVKENDSNDDVREEKQASSKKLEGRKFDDETYGDELKTRPRKITTVESGDENDLVIKSKKLDFSKTDKYRNMKKEPAQKSKEPIKMNKNNKESDEIVDTDPSGNSDISTIVKNESDEENYNRSDDASDENDESKNKSDSSKSTCDKQSKGKNFKCEDDNEEDDIWADSTDDKKKIKYSIKFAHEKHKASHTQDDNIMRKIHGMNRKKHKYNDDSEEDSYEDHVHPKRLKFIDDDDDYY